MSQREKVECRIVAVLFAVAASLVPSTATLAQESVVSQRVAARKQDLPPPEFEEVLTAPADQMLHENAPPVQPIVESGGITSGTTQWSGDGLNLGSEFSEPLHLDEDGTPMMHDMPELQSSGTWLWRGHWYTEQSLVLLYRAMPNNKILSRDQTFTQRTLGNGQSLVTQSADNQDPLQTGGQTFRTEPGVKLTIGNIIGRDANNRDHAIEFSFFGFFDFEGRDRMTASQGPGMDDGDFNVIDLAGAPFRLDGLNLDDETGPSSGLFNLPISVVGFSNALSHSYLLESDLNSYELNLKKRTRLRRDRVVLQPNGKWHRDINSGSIMTLLGGLRMVRHNERFLWDSSGAIDLAGGNTGSGRYEVLAHNDMVGVQLGAGILQQKAHWHWGMKMLGGALQNFADRKIDIGVTERGTTTGFADNAQDEQIAFLGEAGAYIGWQIRPHMTLKASYDALYYTGIVLARDGVEINAAGAQQIPPITFTPATISGTFRPLEVRSDAMYHAISAGFEIVW